MTPSFQSAKPSLPRIVLVGLVVPVLLCLLDRWLLAREYDTGDSWHRWEVSYQAMSVFVLQVAFLSVLCGRLIQPAWLRWTIYAWCLALTDLNAVSSLTEDVGQVLITSQIGLITVWAILGTSSWKIRLPVVLLLIPSMLVQIAQ